MKKTWIVLKTEFINTVTRRSFILTLILVPLVPALILGGLSLFGDDQPIEWAGAAQPQPDDEISQGFLDRAQIITQKPDWLDAGRLVSFNNETDAKDAVLSGAISGYFVIQPDYIETGSIHYYSQDFNPMNPAESTWVINALIQFNLLGGDQTQFETFQNPIQVEYFDLEPEEVGESIDMSNPIAFYIPYGMTMLFYVLIVTTASMMMNSVAKEKENRVMEILVSSIKPHQLLTGKIFGLALVGVLQLIVWLGSALVMLRLGGNTLQIPPTIQLSIGILAWGIIFFFLGYLLYATIMAGVGALVGSVKEASQATFIVILPILIPLMLVGTIINQPNSTLAVVLSLIPFTAPNTIMTRLAVTAVPFWQLLVAIALLIITIFILIRGVSGMFRAQLLLTGQKFSLGLFIRTLRGKHPDLIES